ncbi:hypothetical protein GGR54DRAFT_644309 [Hypoxylon sp. NC1633]|nr:hypothetical protein GGR54DRAFT_644309 [Hypoxylon sp. NC1633]
MADRKEGRHPSSHSGAPRSSDNHNPNAAPRDQRYPMPSYGSYHPQQQQSWSGYSAPFDRQNTGTPLSEMSHRSQYSAGETYNPHMPLAPGRNHSLAAGHRAHRPESSPGIPQGAYWPPSAAASRGTTYGNSHYTDHGTRSTHPSARDREPHRDERYQSSRTDARPVPPPTPRLERLPTPDDLEPIHGPFCACCGTGQHHEAESDNEEYSTEKMERQSYEKKSYTRNGR